MKLLRYLFLILGIRLVVTATAQYNPPNPPEPNIPDPVYELEVVTTPSNGGQTNITKSRFTAGSTVILQASPYSGFIFAAWTDTEGNVLSTDRQYQYTMPAKHTVVVARFDYNPANPNEPKPEYVRVNVSASPTDACRVSGSGRYAAGSTITITAADVKSGFRFNYFTVDDEIVSVNRSFQYVVKETGNDIIAVCTLDPENPGDPGNPANPDHVYRLKTAMLPENAGYVNLSEGRFTEGEKINLEALLNNGFRFDSWIDELGQTVGSSAKLLYNMPARNVTLTAHATYDPTNPQEPTETETMRNVIYGSRRNVTPGSDIVYDIMLENIDPVCGINIDINIPNGFIADFQGIMAGDRASGHTVSAQQVNGSQYRLFVRGSEPLAGSNGSIVRIPIHVNADLEPGSSHIVILTRGIVILTDGSEQLVRSTEGRLRIGENQTSLPDSPDLIVCEVMSPASNVMPGDKINVSWKVKNQGNLNAEGGWKEYLWLADNSGNIAPLATLYNTTDISYGSQISRDVTVNIPDKPGIEGNLDIVVTVEPYASSGEIEQLRTNNTARTENKPLRLGKRLIVNLPTSIYEDTSARVLISRSGYWDESSTLILKVNGAEGRINCPASAQISAGQSGTVVEISVDDNDEYDGTVPFTLMVSAAGYDDCVSTTEIIDDEYPDLELTLPAETITENETVTLTVSLPFVSDKDVKVSLGCDAPSRFHFPTPVITIPSGQLSAEAEVRAIPNNTVENRIDVSFFASAPGYGKGEAWVYLEDDDMPALELEITPDEVNEGAGPRAVRGLLRRVSNKATHVDVVLSDNMPNVLIYPQKITLPPHIEEYDFNIGIVDNAFADGERKVTLTAAVFIKNCGCQATGESSGSVSREITILDNDGPSLGLTMSSATLRKNATRTVATVTRNTSAREPLEVTLTTNPPGILNVPEKITIPAGSKETVAEITAPAGAFTGSDLVVTINATHEGYSRASAPLLLSDKALPDATVTVTPAYDKDLDVMPGMEIPVYVRVANEGNSMLPDAVRIDFHFNGNTSSEASFITTSTVMPGEADEQQIMLAVPEIPGTYLIQAIVNPKSSFEELTYTNNSSAIFDVKVKSPFNATIDADRKVIVPGEEIILSGMAPGYDKQLEVYYITSGARRSMKFTPESDGRFRIAINPEFAGDYTAGVCIPGEGKSEEMTSFTVKGLALSYNGYLTYDLEPGTSSTLTLQAVNRTSQPLSGISYTTHEQPTECDVTFDGPSELGAYETADIKVTVNALKATSGKNWQKFKIDVHPQSGGGATKEIFYYGTPGQARLEASANSINTTVTIGRQRSYRLTLGNTGSTETGNIRLSLPTFMSSALGNTLSSIKPGDTETVELLMHASADMQLNVPVTGTIAINCNGGSGLVIPFEIEPVSDRTGTLVVEAKDEYTFYAEGSPRVAGADVTVSHPVTGKLIANGKTDDSGIWSITLPEGYYTLEVSAEKHGIGRQTILIDPGRNNEVPVFLPYEAITYSWNVEETTVDDEYDIVTTVDFETRVPKPVILVEFPEIHYRNEIIYYTLTNKGLIKADGIELLLPESGGLMEFTPMGDLTIDELLPGETKQIAVMTHVENEGEYPDFKCAVSSFEMSTYDTGGQGANQAPLKESGVSHVYIPCGFQRHTVLVNKYDCDPVTGNPIPAGKKAVQAMYSTGDCGFDYYYDYYPMNYPDYGYGGPNMPELEYTYLQKRLINILVYGCLNDCEKAMANTIKTCYDTIKTCLFDGSRDKSDDNDKDDLQNSGSEKIAPALVIKGIQLAYKTYTCLKGLVEPGKDIKDDIKNKNLDMHHVASLVVAVGGCIPYGECIFGIIDCLNNATSAYDTCSKLKEALEQGEGTDSNSQNDDTTSTSGEQSNARQKQTEGMTQPAPVVPSTMDVSAYGQSISSIGEIDGLSEEFSEMRRARDRRAKTVILALKTQQLTTDFVRNILGNGNWDQTSGVELATMFAFIAENLDEHGYVITGETALAGKPVTVDRDTYLRFLDRLNSTVDHYKNPEIISDNMIPDVAFESFAEAMQRVETNAVDILGYANMDDFTSHAEEYMKYYEELSEDPSDGVCTSISMEFNQTMVMTRQAFRGKFTMTNGNDKGAMTDIRLLMRVRDKDGNPVGDREFSISTETLSGFVGEMDSTSGWTLQPSGSGEATIMFVPSKFAAPVEPQVYSFGGLLSYYDPFTGTEVSRELSPVEMTVKPSPLLDMDYFMQRDVLGDDPLTPDIQERSEPAEFALIITNRGYGEARNLCMTTAQPTIVDNSRGLDIDFTIEGCSLSGVLHNLALGGNTPTDFGNLAPNSTVYAQWWLKSALMGHFTSYDISANQVSAFGCEDMSLIRDINIHELIHGMTNPTGDGSVRLFLANEIEDAGSLPDMIWSSATGEPDNLGIISNTAIIDWNDTECVLKVGAGNGWNYGKLPAPWRNNRRVTNIRRLSDGREFPADNVWVTPVTLINSSAPKHENTLHFAFELGDTEETFIISLEGVPDIDLDITDVQGLPDDGNVKLMRLEDLQLTFNTPVNKPTFGRQGVRIFRNCVEVPATNVEVRPGKSIKTQGYAKPSLESAQDNDDSSLDGRVFTIEFNDATLQSGHYSVVIDLSTIEDENGYPGSGYKTYSWNQLADGTVTVNCKVEPSDSGEVSFDSKKVGYQDEVKVSAIAAEGYVFSHWKENGDFASGVSAYTFRPMRDTELTACFSQTNHWITVEWNENEGSVLGSSGGIYPYGTQLSMIAVPAVGYEFTSWSDHNDEPFAVTPRLDFTVKQDLNLHPVFAQIETGLHQVHHETSTQIVPTAVHDYFKVTGDFTELRNITIIDMAGKNIRSITGYTKGVPVNIETLPAGVYLVRVTTDLDVSVHKIVKL